MALGARLHDHRDPRAEHVAHGVQEDEDTSELSFWVDLEDNFTLGEASEEMQRYERFVEPYKATFGFRNVVARFDSDSGEIDLRWPDRIDPKRLDRYRAQLRRELQASPGTAFTSAVRRRSTATRSSS